MNKVLIIGSGPASLAAAYSLSKNKNNKITIITADESLGAKYLVTGNGRCNIGNSHLLKDDNYCYISKDEFIKSPFSNEDLNSYFSYLEEAKIDLYEDEEGRYYPFSFSAANVQNLLSKLVKDIDIIYNEIVTTLDTSKQVVITQSNKHIEYDKLIITTGGLSSKYRDLLSPLNLKFNPYTPALTALTPDFTWPKKLIGQKLKGTMHIKDRQNYTESGELLFKEKELSGIMIYNASLLIKQNTKIEIDITTYNNQKARNTTNPQSYLPLKIASCISELPIRNGKLCFTVKTPTSFDHAQVAKGGISLSEINMKTMSLIKHPNIYVAGEIIDLTGICGGYNLAAAIMMGLRIK